MSPALLTHLFTKPALLIAAGLVLLGAAAGRGAPLGDLEKPDGESSCRAAKDSLDALYRGLGVSLASDQAGGFTHAAIFGACDAVGVCPVDLALVASRRVVDDHDELRRRLRLCPVGPSPPVVIRAGA